MNRWNLKGLTAGLFFVLLGTPALAHATSWEVDTVHSVVQFSVRHMMISNVIGHFGVFNGTAELDPADPSTAKVRGEVEIKSIDTNDAKRDEHLRSGDFFDAEKHPKMSFVSKRVERKGPGKLDLIGDLTMRGVTKEVTFHVEGFDTAVKDPWGQQRLGGTATTVVNRKDFGLVWNKGLETGGVLVGEDVTITLQVELVAKK